MKLHATRLVLAFVLAMELPAAAQPIVFALADEPVELGLVASVAKPGGNITGLAGLMAELTAKRLVLLKEALPRVTRVAVLWGPYPFSAAVLKQVEGASHSLGVRLYEIEADKPTDLDSAFERMKVWRVQALLVLPHPMFVAQRVRFAELAAKHRLPSELSPQGIRRGWWADVLRSGYGAHVAARCRLR